MELANKMAKGTRPFAYMVTKIICGPDSGIIPRAVASAKTVMVLS